MAHGRPLAHGPYLGGPRHQLAPIWLHEGGETGGRAYFRRYCRIADIFCAVRGGRWRAKGHRRSRPGPRGVNSAPTGVFGDAKAPILLCKDGETGGRAYVRC